MVALTSLGCALNQSAANSFLPLVQILAIHFGTIY